MQTVTRKLATFALTLTLCAAFVCALSLFAADFTDATSWMAPTASAAIQAPANVVFRNAQNRVIGEGRPYPYDRIARGEWYCATITAPRYPARVRIRTAVGVIQQFTINGQYYHVDTVPTNPSHDDMRFAVIDPTNGHTYIECRLPIGRR